jgi:transcriptional regulator with XRE-family HTH domain
VDLEKCVDNKSIQEYTTTKDCYTPMQIQKGERNMANTEMIREYIRASGYKLQYVARAMQISPNALGQKLQGHTQFKLNEAERLSAVLGLSMYERDLCFFEEQNRREALARRADEKRRGECDKRAEK